MAGVSRNLISALLFLCHFINVLNRDGVRSDINNVYEHFEACKLKTNLTQLSNNNNQQRIGSDYQTLQQNNSRAKIGKQPHRNYNRTITTIAPKLQSHQNTAASKLSTPGFLCHFIIVLYSQD